MQQLTSVSSTVAQHVEWIKLLDQTYEECEGIDEKYEIVSVSNCNLNHYWRAGVNLPECSEQVG